MTEVLCVVAIVYLYGLIRTIMYVFDEEEKLTVFGVISAVVWPLVPSFLAISMGLHK